MPNSVRTAKLQAALVNLRPAIGILDQDGFEDDWSADETHYAEELIRLAYHLVASFDHPDMTEEIKA